VTRRYGGVHAVEEVSLEVARGERHAIIGPNGAGKTTLFKLVSRLEPVSAGRIELFGRDITRLPPHSVARLGLGRTYQITQLFSQLRVIEVGLALAADPKLLLLDEPAAGLSGSDRGRIRDLVSGLPQEITVLLIEHDMELALGLADRVSCLHNGTCIAEGTPDEIKANQQVQDIYLGRGEQ
jgi:branched-chain amino acid transport system ATP-binding protein